MLVDAAKYGDVEIPVFCYEPKLGQPVGACRMCLVEIEGIPKLQTACSTPVKDGMVVHTQTERVHDAQRAVVEFLLINHPLDCPVCDKGGECPLQDITYGWGPGTSRFIEPKRHFQKPLELSPLVAIDRERCILCYRCVRFSQEIAEDYQLILLERGAHSFVGTFDGHPYVAPFSGNIVELCPVGALTSSAYRFRARPWDIEGAGSICTLCPAQCNVEFTVRDERVMRVLARDHDEVDDGWLCDKGRYAYQHVHVDERITEPLVREGEVLMPASWEKALDAAAQRAQEGRRPRRRAGRRARPPTRRRSCSRGCSARASARATSPRAPAASCRSTSRARSPTRRCRRASRTSSSPTPSCCSSPTRSTTPRSSTCASARACAATASRVAVASARPTALDPRADAVLRTAPSGGAALLVALDAALGRRRRRPRRRRERRRLERRRRQRLRRGADRRGRGHRDRLRRAPALRPRRRRRGARAAQPRLAARPRRPRRRGPARDPGEHERARPARGRLRRRPRRRLRDARRAAAAARPRSPGASPTATSTRSTCCTPTRCARIPTARCGSRRCDTAQAVIAHESVLTETVREYADRRLPGRGLRREGGHARAPRRPPAAPARGDRPRQGRRPGRRRPRRAGR